MFKIAHICTQQAYEASTRMQKHHKSSPYCMIYALEFRCHVIAFCKEQTKFSAFLRLTYCMKKAAGTLFKISYFVSWKKAIWESHMGLEQHEGE